MPAGFRHGVTVGWAMGFANGVRTGGQVFWKGEARTVSKIWD